MANVLIERAKNALRHVGLDPRALRFSPFRHSGAADAALHWLFIATLPNSGSTAFAKMVSSSPVSVSLNDRAEGQWLLPGLCEDGKRWDPDLPVDWKRVRRVWMGKIRGKRQGPAVVLEKSPANLCRFRNLLAAFSDMETTPIRLTRDPYAVCASWDKRYGAERIKQGWHPELGDSLRTVDGYFRALGALCGERMAMLAGLEGIVAATFSYEEVTMQPETAAARLLAICPALRRVDGRVEVAVKDYAKAGLRNMNEEQIALLDAQQIAWITEGLVPHAAALEKLGYTLR